MRSATSKISLVNDATVLPFFEACAASDCAVSDSTGISCFVMRPWLRREYVHQAMRPECTDGSRHSLGTQRKGRRSGVLHPGVGRPVRPAVGSTTIGIKSYVPSSRSIPSSSEQANVAPRIRTRADSFVRNSYTSGVTLSSPLDRHRTRIRAGGMRVALD